MSQTVSGSMQPSTLTDNQYAVLRAIVTRADRGDAFRTVDGNEDRTVRSLVRKGLVRWEPPGTHVSVVPTEAGISFPQSHGRSGNYR